MIQDRQYAQECLVLCGFLWPITDSKSTENHVGDPSLESKLLSCVSGSNVSEQALYEIGERVFNLNRAILVREGHRGVEDDRLPDPWYTVPLKTDMTNPELLVPGKGDEAVSRKGAIVDKEAFEKTMREYYQIRQWDVERGLQTSSKLRELKLPDIAHDLEQRGLAL